jgi:tRNA 5-methylaminomethyl-2-thiouridine biosynthesis bifunctional protein
VGKVSKSSNLAIGELGFGTGLNLLATLDCLEKSNVYPAEFSYYSVEKYPLSKEKINEIIFEYSRNFPEIYKEFLINYDKLFCEIKCGFNRSVWLLGKIKVYFNLYFGDVFDFLSELGEKIDCWYLDGYSPDKNPEMWSEDVCRFLFENSKVSTTLATYTASGFVKQNLRAAGFFVKRLKGFDVKRHKLFAKKYDTNIIFSEKSYKEG